MSTRAPNSHELAAFRTTLAALGVTSRAAEPHLRSRDLRRHEVLMSAGDDANDSGFVISGVVREYYVLEDGTERTRGFALPSETYGSLSDALCKRPSRVFVRAEADSTVLTISWAHLEALAAKSLEWERLRAVLIERLYLRKSVREYELLGLDAMGRYRSLLMQQPTLEQHVPQVLIASYVGITAVHLSRLRRRLSPKTPRAPR